MTPVSPGNKSSLMQTFYDQPEYCLSLDTLSLRASTRDERNKITDTVRFE